MPPYFKREGAAQTGTTGAVSPAWPTHVAGDVGILIVEANYGTTGTQNPIALDVAAGFVQIGTTAQNVGGGGVGGTQCAVYWCRATSGAMGAPTVSANNDHIIARILTFGDVIAEGDPINATAKSSTPTSGATSHTVPSITTTQPRCLVVWVCSSHIDSAAEIGVLFTNAALEGVHEVTDVATATATGGGFCAGAGIKLTAGVVGTTAITTAGASVTSRIVFALLPGDEADSVAPTITLISPADGEVHRETEVVVDVEDDVELALVVVLARFPSGPREVVYTGDGFDGRYLGCSVEELDEGRRKRFHFFRDGGWLAGTRLEFPACDAGGNAAVVVL